MGLPLAACSGLDLAGAPPAPEATAAIPPPAPAAATAAAIGGVFAGPIGGTLSDADREAAWDAQVGALESGQRRSWRGSRGVFGFVEPGAEAGAGCRAFSQTVYVAGRPSHGQGVGCRQPDGSWKMTG
jgi:surface antigen